MCWQNTLRSKRQGKRSLRRLSRRAFWINFISCVAPETDTGDSLVVGWHFIKYVGEYSVPRGDLNLDSRVHLVSTKRRLPMYQRTVLIVEDEFLIRMMLADTLADEGYEV